MNLIINKVKLKQFSKLEFAYFAILQSEKFKIIFMSGGKSLKLLDDVIHIEQMENGHIYHYTTLNALQGILDNNEFWVTKSDFLNDKSEFQYTYDLFRNNFLCNIEELSFRKKLINEFDALINEDNDISRKPLSGYYIASFSTDSDNLALWSEFSNSMGYNLEIDAEPFIHSFDKMIMWHGKVVYDKEKQLLLLKEALEKAMTWRIDYGGAKSLSDFSDNTPDSITKYIALDLYAFCSVYAMFFKQPEFNSESEYRVVLSSIHEESDYVKNPECLFFRPAKEILIPYIKVHCKAIDSLKAITVGPKNNIDIATAGISMYCRSKGITIPIRKSRIPLRY